MYGIYKLNYLIINTLTLYYNCFNLIYLFSFLNKIDQLIVLFYLKKKFFFFIVFLHIFFYKFNFKRVHLIKSVLFSAYYTKNYNK